MDSPEVAAPPVGPSVDPITHWVTFRLETGGRCIPKRVWYHLRAHGADPTFHLEGDQWVARIPRPPVARMEYLLLIAWPDGSESMVPDPGNPRRVRSVFGDKSEIAFPGYVPPDWVAEADAADDQDRREAEALTAEERRATSTGQRRPTAWISEPISTPGLVAVPARTGAPADLMPPVLGEGTACMCVRSRDTDQDARLRGASLTRSPERGALVFDPGTADVIDSDAAVAVTGRMHVPADSTPAEPLPLLVVHDGPEYADLAQLLRYVTTLARGDPGLRCRVLLLQPIDRDRSYAASPAYARALVTRMLPSVTGAFATSARPVGLGASLGGLAMMHAAISHPGTFAGVFSQSGSFFRPQTDHMERWHPHFDRIARFVEDIDVDPGRFGDLRVAMTCGTGEENLANNRSVARRLARIGVSVQLEENPDGHNYTGWRDSLDPGLRRLLRSAWGRAGNRAR